MKRLLRIFALLTAAAMLIWIAGCGGDDEEEEAIPPPDFVSWSVTEGQEVAGNASISATLSAKPDEATITVAGATGTTTIAGKVITWTPTGTIPPGSHAVTISASNAGGDVEGAIPVNITAVAADTVAPTIDDGKCDPKNGADGVDPADYPEKLVIVFSETLSQAKVSAMDPEISVTEELAGDTLTLTLMKVTLSNETEYSITVAAKDAAGNSADLEYSFATMAKEE